MATNKQIHHDKRSHFKQKTYTFKTNQIKLEIKSRFNCKTNSKWTLSDVSFNLNNQMTSLICPQKWRKLGFQRVWEKQRTVFFIRFTSFRPSTLALKLIKVYRTCIHLVKINKEQNDNRKSVLIWKKLFLKV